MYVSNIYDKFCKIIMPNCEGCNKSLVLKKLRSYAAPDGACSVNSCTISGYHIYWFMVDNKNKDMYF